MVIGAMAIYRAARRMGNHGRRGAIVALVVGLIAVVNGGLNLAVATGDPFDRAPEEEGLRVLRAIFRAGLAWLTK